MRHHLGPARPTGRTLVHLLLAAAAVGVLALAPQAYAATFSDVGAAHPFHDEVEAIVQAGITTGFSDGRYRPADPVTRQSMAAFLQRGLGRVSSGTGEAVLSSGAGAQQVASATIRAGGAPGRGSGFLVATATTSTVDMGIGDPGANLGVLIDGPGGQDSHLGFLQVPASQGGDTASSQLVLPVTGGQEVTLVVRAEVLSNGVTDVIVQSTLAVQFVPLGADGGAPA